jgi:ribosomal protein S3
MSAIPHTFTDVTDAQISELEGLLETRRGRVELERAEAQVRFYVASAKEAELIGRPALQVELLRAAENWQSIADGLREEIVQ